jgi:hydrogenase maturation protein HypF
LAETLPFKPLKKRKKAIKILVRGIVQGVGFRPFVYNLALKRNLKGYVTNTSYGVEIEVQGDINNINKFINDLKYKNPPLTEIIEFQIKEIPLANYKYMEIKKSHCETTRSLLIAPDIAICEECLKEMLDPTNRRFLYPFINCTNCGPRYSIIKDLPYDRERTSMQVFKMCRACQDEYDDPHNRRFHAQPNACKVCGPKVWLAKPSGEKIESKDPIYEAAVALKQGKIVAIRGIGGFHLACDAKNSKAIKRLRERKLRWEKPLALMVKDLQHIKPYVTLSNPEERLLVSERRPIVLLKKQENIQLPSEIAPNNQYLGIMLPYTPLHHILFQNAPPLLVMTSGNLTEEPIAIQNQEAIERLNKIADLFLMHDREILIRSDDSVVTWREDGLFFIRRSRGFAPLPIILKTKIKGNILALGGELKNTFCLLKQDMAFISQHIGDMDNLLTFEFFKSTLKNLKNILDIFPQLIGYDLHPEYFTTKYAAELSLPRIGVQHHHAHMVSVMAEYGLEDKVIGIILDGTGYGLDHTIWGGEVLLGNLESFQRIAHLRYVPMPGGEKAIKEPWRMAVAYLYDTFGYSFPEIGLSFIKKIEKNKILVIREMIKQGVNSPFTSSCGRAFDAVASLIGIRNKVSYEAQAAIELEMLTEDIDKKSYKIDIIEENGILLGDLRPLIKTIVSDLRQKVPEYVISQRFHYALVLFFSRIVEIIRSQTGIKEVVLSGGVMQNRHILGGLRRNLEGKGFSVFIPRKMPCNDAGLCLGQALIAARKWRERCV